MANAISLVYHSLHGHARSIWRAKIDAARGIHLALRKRKEIQKTLQASDTEISKWMDHRWLSPYKRMVL